MFALLVVSSLPLSAQTSGQSLWGTLRDFILPEKISGIYTMREFIRRQDTLVPVREEHLRRVDRIWNYAVYITDGDIETALFIATWATLPYHTFPAYIPLVNWKITIPVSTEPKDAFKRRLQNLPSLLYTHSGNRGDRDKLPHFFGAAYIQYKMRCSLITASVGESIEIGEKFFKLEGAYDPEDIDANTRGIAFGKALRRELSVMPSEFFNDHVPGE